jgi:hypothetical protein
VVATFGSALVLYLLVEGPLLELRPRVHSS